MNTSKSIYIGKAGELRVRSELMMRGLTPCVPTPESKRIYKKHKEQNQESKYEKYKNNWEVLK